MFSDKDLVKLQKDNKYRKTNKFKQNFHLTQTIVKTGIDSISADISSEGIATLSMTFTKALWVILKYLIITREITLCRSRIIENVLNTSYIMPNDKIIKDSLPAGGFWIEYKKEKVAALGRACIEYISTVEHRVILASFSYLEDESQQYQAFYKARQDIDQIFLLANNDLIQMEIREAMMKYLTALNNQDCAQLAQKIFMENSRSGNLTNTVEDRKDKMKDSEDARSDS